MNRLKSIVNKFFPPTPATAGKESAMGDNATANTTATPPATSGGISLADVKQLFTEFAGTLETKFKSIGDSVAELQKGHSSLTESLAKIPGPTKPEEVAKLVSDQIAANTKTQSEATAKNETKAALRKKIVDAHLKGVPESLLNLPDTDDEKALTEAATKLRKDVEALPGVKLADVAGATGDGGKTPAAAASTGKSGFLTMPGASA